MSEKEISNSFDSGNCSYEEKISVSDLFENYISQKRNVRRNTKRGYQYLLKNLRRDSFGEIFIQNVKVSDAKLWLLKLSDNGLSYGTVAGFKRTLKSAFDMAAQDDLIRKNPFDFKLNSFLKNDAKCRNALTEEEERRFLEFIHEDPCYQKYYNEIVLLLRTGLRISEFCGICRADVDFENRVLYARRQLMKVPDAGYITSPPKSTSGVRVIPMSQEVSQAFLEVIRDRKEPVIKEIDGIKDFLFINRNGYPRVSSGYESIFRNSVKKYNKTHDEPLPQITPHVLRHTFCSKLANAGMSPKSLQYVMGHSNISITLNTYTHISLDTVKQEMQKIMD